MLKQWFVAACVVLACMGSADAQSKKGANGGQMAESQGHPIEFVSKGQEIIFYMGDDDGTPLDTKGITARATVQDGGKTTTIKLEPAAPNLLVGKLQAPLAPKARVVFSATLKEDGHTHTLTARYVAE